MLTVGRAFAWELLGKHRFWLPPVVGYLLILAVAVQLCPAGTFEEQRSKAILAWLSLPLWQLVGGLLMIFSDAERTDLLARASGYPLRRLTLPLPTPALAAWPLGLGALCMALYWLALGGLILR